MKFANAKALFLMIGCACLSVTAIALDKTEKPEDFFTKLPLAKAEGTQFAQKTDESKPKPEDLIAYHVRCWQQGILVVDEPNWRSPQVQTRFVAMKPIDGNDLGLYLLEFSNAFCQLKKK